MKNLAIYLIRYPIIQLVFIIISITVIRVFFVGSIAYCEGWSNIAVETVYYESLNTNPWPKTEYDSLMYLQWHKYNTEKYAKSAEIIQQNKTNAALALRAIKEQHLIFINTYTGVNSKLTALLNNPEFVKDCPTIVFQMLLDANAKELDPITWFLELRYNWILNCPKELFRNDEIIAQLQTLLLKHDCFSSRFPLIVEAYFAVGELHYYKEKGNPFVNMSHFNLLSAATHELFDSTRKENLYTTPKFTAARYSEIVIKYFKARLINIAHDE